MIKKFRFSLALLIMVLIAPVVFFAGCGRNPSFTFDILHVGVHPQYYEKFDNQKFTVEDFNWSNIEKIEHMHFPHSNLRIIIVHLREQSEQLVKAARVHIERLDFVSWVDFNTIFQWT